jgi:hypothetical protein
MKWTRKLTLSIAILCLFVLALPTQALAASPGLVVIGDRYTLESGETLDEDLLVLGGTVTLEAGSFVNGNILILGGSLEVAGEVDGDITAAGGFIELASTAVVRGDIVYAGGNLSRDPGATVTGETRSETGTPYSFIIPFHRDIAPFSDIQLPGGVQVPNFSVQVNPFFEGLWFILRSLLWALLAMLVVMFFSNQADRAADAMIKQPLVTGGLGLLTAVLAPLVVILLVLTICLIPVALILALGLMIAWAFGLIALGMELGQRFARAFKSEWHPALAAGLGTFILMLVLNGIGWAIPCIGWVPGALAGAIGLGGVLLTRFGSQRYPAAFPLAPAPIDVPPSVPPLEPGASSPSASSEPMADEPPAGSGGAAEN